MNKHIITSLKFPVLQEPPRQSPTASGNFFGDMEDRVMLSLSYHVSSDPNDGTVYEFFINDKGKLFFGNKDSGSFMVLDKYELKEFIDALQFFYDGMKETEEA